MEFKHFSHNHSLIFQQLPQGREIKCSGCKSPGSGSVYVCWQCSYFLHEQCFRATRSLKHPSHPLHPLTLVPYPTYPSNSFYCNTCTLIGSGFSYSCSECEFDLHVHCAMAGDANTIHQFYPQVSYPNPNYVTPPGTSSFNSPQVAPHMPQPASYQPVQNYPNPGFPPQAVAGSNFAPQVSYQAPPPATQTAYTAPNLASASHQAPPPPPPAAQTAYTTPNLAPPAGMISNQQSSSQQPQQNNPIPVYPQPSATVHIPSTVNNQPKLAEIKHFSHVHGLKLTEFQKQEDKKCSGCEYAIDGDGYTCVEPQCNFYLDKTCFESPMEVRHKSHLDHPLKLLTKPPYEAGQFTCNACLKDGSGFVYNCSTCSFDLHVDCIAWPESVKREDHKHPLTLFYASPAPKTEGQQDQVTSVCDVCQTAVHDMAWTYYCHECDFGTHLECVISQVRPVEKSEEEIIRETAIKLQVLQLLLSGRQNILL